LNRDTALDALRGLAVLGMVLSGAVAYGGVLPAWMYHVQVPPPLHKFMPAVAGVGWVDLVFPFFLFCQGAAIPLAAAGPKATWGQVLVTATRRGLLIAGLALFYFQLRPGPQPRFGEWGDNTLALAAFALLCLALTRRTGRPARLVRLLALAASAALLLGLPVLRGESFNPQRNDIILMVLANMAFFGTLIFHATRSRPLWRLALLPLVLGAYAASGQPGSPAQAVMQATPLPWLYQFNFLKYLLIVVPGMFFGEWLLRQRAQPPAASGPRWRNATLAVLCTALVVLNTTLLYTRELGWNMAATLAGLALLAALLRRADATARAMTAASGWLLVLGLLIEPLQGGIHKDPATASYFFVTAGLAGFSLLALQHLQALPTGTALAWCRERLAEVGRNPLVAYTAGALLLTPVMKLSGLYPLWAGLNQTALQGLARGLLFTAAVAALTLVFTRRGWLWKT
jgi:predicted acyltransferase